MTGATLGMTDNYNSSSLPQKAVVQSTIPFIQQAIDVLDVTSSASSPLIIADFGSSQGLNSIYAMKSIIEYLRETKKDMREPLIVHNDLPTNDWTSVFQLLVEDNSYRGVASGRSFYDQCLPKNSLSIGYSSSSIHWLSTKPCNISDDFFIDFAQDPREREAFKHQADLDYTRFLQHRSHELAPGGVFVLAILCRNHHGKSGLESISSLLYQCAQLLPLTPQELLDYSFPTYLRSYEECIDEKHFAQCSLELVKSGFVSVEFPSFKQWREGQLTLDEVARANTSFVRSWSESILQQTLINNGRAKEDLPSILNRFWTLYECEASQRLDVHPNSMNYTSLILKKSL